eukprot:COSAG04_NODE_1036_length_8609_cov_33.941716_3_plen_31_part_00
MRAVILSKCTGSFFPERFTTYISSTPGCDR